MACLTRSGLTRHRYRAIGQITISPAFLGLHDTLQSSIGNIGQGFLGKERQMWGNNHTIDGTKPGKHIILNHLLVRKEALVDWKSPRYDGWTSSSTCYLILPASERQI